MEMGFEFLLNLFLLGNRKAQVLKAQLLHIMEHIKIMFPFHFFINGLTLFNFNSLKMALEGSSCPPNCM